MLRQPPKYPTAMVARAQKRCSFVADAIAATYARFALFVVANAVLYVQVA